MKILFLISSINSKSNGLGGHFNSLIATCNELKKHHEIIILNIGPKKSKRIFSKTVDIHKIHIKVSLINFLKSFKLINELIKKENPDILHSFDRIAFYWGRYFSNKYRIKSVLTKCGGSNHGYYPIPNCLILYSEENLLFFEKNTNFRNTKLFLIPNRISKFKDDYSRIKDLKKEIVKKKTDLNTFTFLRITRIGNYYMTSTQMLIKLVKDLKLSGVNCNCIIIGTVESQESFELLKSKITDDFTLITSDYFTNNAKELINISDCVLGSGRSLMEAACKGKPLLTPTLNGVSLLGEHNFDTAFRYNFSERIDLKSYNYKKELESIKALIKDNQIYQEYSAFSLSIFQKHFNAELINERITEIYRKAASYEKNNLKDNLKNLLVVLKNLISEV